LNTGLVVALDDPDLSEAESMARLLTERVSGFKVGLTLFGAHGSDAIRVVGRHAPVFCDLKLHDIPEQVRAVASVLTAYRVWMLSVHAAGGSEMVRAAVEATAGGEPAPIVAGVTVLTSLSPAALAEVGQGEDPVRQAVRLGLVAVGAGARALVCSGQEVSRIRAAVSPEVMLIVTGIRPAGAAPADQARVATPQEAAAAGADYVVVGRPITQAADPVLAADQIIASLRSTRRRVPIPRSV
jgi:orotidine-5'-phosphate decarboxylase